MTEATQFLQNSMFKLSYSAMLVTKILTKSWFIKEVEPCFELPTKDPTVP